MKYLGRSFTLPASTKMSDIKWDYSFLSDDEFKAKHGMTKEEFNGRSLQG